MITRSHLELPYPEYPTDIEFCRALHKSYGKSFYAGTLLFSQEEHDATCALYAFFRYPDEIVDTIHKDDSAKAAEGLERWRSLWSAVRKGASATPEISGAINADAAAVDAVADMSTAAESVAAANAAEDERKILRAASYVFSKYAIPEEYADAFLDSMLMDTAKDRYETYADLEAYMYGSAAVVGLMMTHVLCANDPAFSDPAQRKLTLDRAKDMGDAFQMTNFIRDVGEDVRDRRRIYLPLEDLRKFGVSEQSVLDLKQTPEFVELIKFEISRTRDLYKRADEGLKLLPRRASVAVRVARELYGAILGKVETRGYDVLSSRARLSFLEKFFRSLIVLLKSAR